MPRTALIIASAALVSICTRVAPCETDQLAHPNTTVDWQGAQYDGFTLAEPQEIPDAYPPGVTLGPIRLPEDDRFINAILVRVDISHDYAGDVTFLVLYDQDRNGVPDASAKLELHQAIPNDPGESSGACPVVLDGCYFFSDGPDGSKTLRSLRGMRTGGDFYLMVSDDAPDDRGSVRGWTVYVTHRLAFL